MRHFSCRNKTHTKEYHKIEEEKKQKAIMKIAVKMFPDVMKNVKES